MTEIGEITKWKGKDCLLGKMEGSILEITLKISKIKLKI